MNKNARYFAACCLMALLFTQFNNCGQYADPAKTTDGTSVLSCETNTCISTNVDNLKITPHLGNGEYAVPANISDFNLGGDCNEGGFPYNTIRWELVLNGVVVRHSGMGVAGGQPANTRCVNGRYLLYVNLAPISEDNVDRTGLQTGNGVRAAYELNVVIYGQQSQSGSVYQSTQGKAVIPLNAI
jgi:hypothetical protein